MQGTGSNEEKFHLLDEEEKQTGRNYHTYDVETNLVHVGTKPQEEASPISQIPFAQSRVFIPIDILLWALMAWSEFGYAFFSKATSDQSLNAPLQRYLYPHLTRRQGELISDDLGKAIAVLSFTDAGLTVLAGSNMKKAREQCMLTVMNARSQFSKGEIRPTLFGANLFLFLISYIVRSLAPWTGYQMDGGDGLPISVRLAGWTMFVGQIATYIATTAPRLKKAPEVLTQLFHLSPEEKAKIRTNLGSRKGIFFMIRTFVNCLNRGWSFYGLAGLIGSYIFGLGPIPTTVFSSVASVSSVYNTFMTQGLNDYDETFSQKEDTKESPIQSLGGKILVYGPLYLVQGEYLFCARSLRLFYIRVKLKIPKMITIRRMLLLPWWA